MLVHEFIYKEKPVAVGVYCKHTEPPKEYMTVAALKNLFGGGDTKMPDYPNICVMGYVKGKEVIHFHSTMEDLQKFVDKAVSTVQEFVDDIFIQEQEAIVRLNLDFKPVHDSYFDRDND